MSDTASIPEYAELISEVCGIVLERDSTLSLENMFLELRDKVEAQPNERFYKNFCFVVDACAYDRDFVGNFTPRWVGETFSYPKNVSNVDNEVLSLWEALAGESMLHPIVRARLADLLWYLKHNMKRKWCDVAIEQYILLSMSKEIEEYERGEYLAYAVNISVASGRTKKQQEELLDIVQQYVLSEIDKSSNPRLGNMTLGLEILYDHNYLDVELLDKAIDGYGVVFFEDLVFKCYKEEAQRSRLKELIDHYEMEAASCKGLLRIHHLDKARQIARRGNMFDDMIRLTDLIKRHES